MDSTIEYPLTKRDDVFEIQEFSPIKCMAIEYTHGGKSYSIAAIIAYKITWWYDLNSHKSSIFHEDISAHMNESKLYKKELRFGISPGKYGMTKVSANYCDNKFHLCFLKESDGSISGNCGFSGL